MPERGDGREGVQRVHANCRVAEPDSAYATSPPSTLTAKHEMARPTPHRKRDVDEDVCP